VALSVRTSTDASATRWRRVVERARSAGKGPRAVLAWAALGGAASHAVSLEVMSLAGVQQVRANDAVAALGSDSEVTAGGGTVPAPNTVPTGLPVATDEFGPIGHVPTVAELQELGWDGVQAPRSDSITVVDDSVAVGSDRPAGPLLRASLWADELYDGRPRAEVYGRRPTPWSTPAEQWVDHAGTERWYSFYVFLPESFVLRTDTAWLDLTQWKGYWGGSPPIAIEVKKDYLRLGGDRTNHNKIANDGRMGAVALGQWTHLTVGIRFSTSADDGWVEAWRDGRQVVARTPVATMDTYQGGPDPIYLKQGIYRSASWDVRQAAYFTPVSVTDVRPVAP